MNPGRQPCISRCTGVCLLVVLTIFAMQLAIRTDQYLHKSNVDRSLLVLKDQKLTQKLPQKFKEFYHASSSLQTRFDIERKSDNVGIKNGVKYPFRYSPNKNFLINWLIEREWFAYLQNFFLKISDILSACILYIQHKSNLEILGAFLTCLTIALVIATIIGTVLDTFMKIINPVDELHLCPLCRQMIREYGNEALNNEADDTDDINHSEDDGYYSQ